MVEEEAVPVAEALARVAPEPVALEEEEAEARVARGPEPRAVVVGVV